MRKIKSHILVFLAPFLFTACDPARFVLITQQEKDTRDNIVFEFKEIKKEDYHLVTASKDSIKIVKYIDGKPEGIYFNTKKENTINVDFPRNTDKKEISLLFGWGNWSDDVIFDFSKLIKSICISRDMNRTCYKNQDEIYKLLITRKEKGKIKFKL